MARVSIPVLAIAAIGVIALAVWYAGIPAATGIPAPWESGARPAGASSSSVPDALNSDVDTVAAEEHAVARHGSVALDILEAIDSGGCVVDVFIAPPCPGNHVGKDGWADGQKGYLVCRNLRGPVHGVVPIFYDAFRGAWIAMTAFLAEDSYVNHATERDNCGPFARLDLTMTGLVVIFDEVIND